MLEKLFIDCKKLPILTYKIRLKIVKIMNIEIKKGNTMGWIIVIIVGAIIGWIASAIMHAEEGLIAYILIGIVGSLLGKWIFQDLLGIGSAAAAGTFSFWGILWGVVGSVILIAILRAIRVIG